MLSVVSDLTANASQLLVLDAQNLSTVATVHLPTASREASTAPGSQPGT
ncbi:hypothetical protein NKH77_25490 [Streptomyces sp. M19]